MDEELDNIITLTDDDGQEVAFEFLDLIEYQDSQYVVLLPKDDEDGEVLILRVDDMDDEDLESYVSVEDDATLEAVFSIFKEHYRDEFDFEE